MSDKAMSTRTSFCEDAVVVKRVYVSPELREYGRLVDLTQAKSGTRTDYGGGSIQTFFGPEQ